MLLALLAVPVQASVARAVPFEDKVREADSIVLGRCTATRSEWDRSSRWILTYSTFQVEKALKGAAVPEVTIVTPGGQVGTVRQETVGVPRFNRGSENVLFVKRGSAGPTVLYMTQGAYQVAEHAGERTIEPLSSGLVMVDSQTGKAASGEPARSFRQFESAVRDAMKQDREGPQRYDVTPEARAPKSAAADLLDLVSRYRFLLGLALVAIAVSTYLILKGR